MLMAKLQRRDVSVTLFDANDSFREIKKHSSMVQMSNVTTLQERKVMNTLIRIAKDTLKRRAEEYLFVSDLGMIKRLA
jgi:hypothetical protein